MNDCAENADNLALFWRSEDCSTIFKKAIYLQRVRCQNDPDSNPYQSKYEARELFTTLLERIEQDSDDNDLPSAVLIKCALLILLGENFTDCEEKADAERHLGRALELLEQKERLSQSTSLLFQDCLNRLGILWASRCKYEKAMEYLLRAESLFNDYHSSIEKPPFRLSELFCCNNRDESPVEETQVQEETADGSTDDNGALLDSAVDWQLIDGSDGWKVFDSNYTHTLYYLAQCYSHLGQAETAAEYCHMTLRRQLDVADCLSGLQQPTGTQLDGRFDRVEWAINAATLSQYYIGVGRFDTARHCLASSQLVFQEHVCAVDGPDGPTSEILLQKRADIFRCWAKYGLELLRSSFDQLESANENNDANSSECSSQPTEYSPDSCNKNPTRLSHVTYEQFPLDPGQYEQQIVCQLVKDYNGARRIFLSVKGWLDVAVQFFTIDSWCSDYIEIQQDLSSLYRLMSLFDNDLSRKAKMQRRRVLILESLTDQLNPTYYLAALKQLVFELGEVFALMASTKMTQYGGGVQKKQTSAGEDGQSSAGSRTLDELCPTGVGLSQDQVSKYNELLRKSIVNYEKYLKLVSDRAAQLPDPLPESETRPVLLAQFSIGRLYGRFCRIQPRDQLQLVGESLKRFRVVSDYCSRHEDAARKMDAELVLCKEMTVLLPAKMDKIRTMIST